jgi:diaminopimelate epimerase
MRFSKYQALGNDYLVMESEELAAPLTAPQIELICSRHYGVGSDGILLRQPDKDDGTFSLQIFNPDGSWVEKSGNGLRIFSRYLWDQGAVADKPFRVETPGGTVTCQVQAKGKLVVVDMGQAIFDSDRIPVSGPAREILRESLEIRGERLEISSVSMGNPHCVVHRDDPSEIEARRLGPLIEIHALFPMRTNVQFMKVLDRENIRIEIWERGAGYTLASGTSSCAVCAVAHRLGLCGDKVTVHMSGGELHIEIGEDYQMRLTGPVGRVAEGLLDEEVVRGGVEEAKHR